VILGPGAYLDSTYGFSFFLSGKDPGLVLGRASGAYNRTSFLVGPEGMVTVGAFTCLNNTYIVCEDRVSIGDHCLLSWGVVISDAALPRAGAIQERETALRAAPARGDRWVTSPWPSKPVSVEDNVWIGFDAVVTGGVTLGRGAIVGSKSLVTQDIPPYAVAVGNPARVVRFLRPDDSAEARERALMKVARGGPGASAVGS
jgi:acetyltransferase-like isoleucine patch superfamily enzyme